MSRRAEEIAKLQRFAAAMVEAYTARMREISAAVEASLAEADVVARREVERLRRMEGATE